MDENAWWLSWWTLQDFAVMWIEVPKRPSHFPHSRIQHWEQASYKEKGGKKQMFTLPGSWTLRCGNLITRLRIRHVNRYTSKVSISCWLEAAKSRLICLVCASSLYVSGLMRFSFPIRDYRMEGATNQRGGHPLTMRYHCSLHTSLLNSTMAEWHPLLQGNEENPPAKP